MAIAVFSKFKYWASKQIFLFLVLICISNIYTNSAFASQLTAFTIAQPSSSPTTPIPSLERRIEILEEDIKRLEGSKSKDVWDKLNAISGLISGGLVAAIGIVATYLYNERQRRNAEAQKQREIAVLQVQTVQSFMPQLQSGQPKEVEAALLAITALGNAQLATELAAIYRTEGAISALSKIASSSNRAVAEQAEKSLEALFNSLIETVVLVSTDQGKQSGGCGFFVSQDGLLVTPGFVVAASDNITVSFKEVDYKAHLITTNDKKQGLVLMRVENGSFPVLPILEQVAVEAGEEVFVLGRDWRQASWSFSSGTVEGYTLESSGERYIKVKVTIYPGFAGAPVINRRSEVVGVVAMKDDVFAYLLPVEAAYKLIHQLE